MNIVWNNESNLTPATPGANIILDQSQPDNGNASQAVAATLNIGDPTLDPLGGGFGGGLNINSAVSNGAVTPTITQTNLGGPSDEVQSLSLVGTPGAQFTLSFLGNTTTVTYGGTEAVTFSNLTTALDTILGFGNFTIGTVGAPPSNHTFIITFTGRWVDRPSP